MTTTVADTQTQTHTKLAPGKLAMSKALGAAFLSHQVEQLEKSVSGSGPGNWRERRTQGGEGRRTPSGGPRVVKKRSDEGQKEWARLPEGQRADRLEREDVGRGYRDRDREKEREREKEKDADVVVVDASVLVHGLYHLKRWCRDGREEVVIVPLEGECVICHPFGPRDEESCLGVSGYAIRPWGRMLSGYWLRRRVPRSVVCAYSSAAEDCLHMRISIYSQDRHSAVPSVGCASMFIVARSGARHSSALLRYLCSHSRAR